MIYVVLYAGMFRLQRKEPYVVVGDVRSVHLLGLFGRAPQPRRAPHVRALHAAGHKLDMEAAQEHAAWRERKRCMLIHFASLFFKISKCIASKLLTQS